MANKAQLVILKKGVGHWNEWRQRNPEVRIDLSGADLTAQNLTHANLNLSDLSLAVLNDADLGGSSLTAATLVGCLLNRAKLQSARMASANLEGTKLVKADLRGAELRAVNFHRADLTAANLSGADLGQAVFIESILSKTSLTRATLGATAFALTSLKAVKGLSSCSHWGPSAIDFHTLMESDRLPEVFRRGCGLSEVFIQYLPEFWNEPIQFYSCFISYSHVDKSFARRLHDALQGRGIRCWLDEHQLLPGDQIQRAVDEGVRLWDKVLLCCSEASLQSWWVDKEIQKALMKEEQLWNERGKETLALIPLNLDGHLFSQKWRERADWKEHHLTSRMAADFTGWERDHKKFEAQLDRVIKALRADSAARQRLPKPKL